MTTSRTVDTDRFYSPLATLTEKVGRPRLRDCTAADRWPSHGVYFFFEDGETRTDARTPRVVRVGTHALTEQSRTTLWARLRQHRGTLAGQNPGGGDHRGSIFRMHVGTALVNSQTWSPEIRGSWLQQHANPPARTAEQQLERAVSTRIGAMPVLVLTVPDRQHRRLIEANAIALLSRRAGGVDPASPGWLGQHAASKQVRDSALWNVEHVDDIYDREFLDLLDDLVCGTSAPSGALEDMHTEVPDTQASRLGDERHYSDQTSWTLQDLILQRHMG